MTYRIGWWVPRTKMCELDEDFNVLTNFDMGFGERNVEDARLFTFRGELYTSYTTYPGSAHNTCHQCYAKINEYGKVLEDHTLRWSKEKIFEKNWQFFEHDDQLYTIYSINPHRIFKVDKGVIRDGALSAKILPWMYGDIRGGTPPVLIDGQFYSWFHSWRRENPLWRKYYVGVYRFDAKPPFKVNAITQPLMEGVNDAEQYKKFHDSQMQLRHAVVFPTGTLFENNQWSVAYGYQDADSRITTFNHSDILSALKSV